MVLVLFSYVCSCSLIAPLTLFLSFRLVEKTLEPLDPDRRAFRLVGGVLVERTVKEVLPSVTQNRENLDQVIATMETRLSEKQKEASEFKAKYNLVTETS